MRSFVQVAALAAMASMASATFAVTYSCNEADFGELACCAKDNHCAVDPVRSSGLSSPNNGKCASGSDAVCCPTGVSLNSSTV